ncbi:MULTISPECIES: hypothetical protein [Alphaproteobacteria]|uniref:hypothetical protein n=1 Tax=Alphaproteobacteria TaxID=28211 RepID=UPI00326564C5
MSKLVGAFFIVAAQIVLLVFVAGPAGAQDATPSSHPLLKPYSDWVNDNIESEFARYWRIYPGDDGREPYLVYCKDDLVDEHAIRGRSVRVRSGSEALGFFTRITGKTAQLLPSSELNAAFELGIIDCIGFGGERVEVAAPASDPDAKGAEPSAAPDSLLTLPQNLDDF